MATYVSKRPYVYGTGRRKSSVARVHLIPGGSGVITINGREIDDYFGLETLKLIVRQPLNLTETGEKFDVICKVQGGNTHNVIPDEMRFAGSVRYLNIEAGKWFKGFLRETLDQICPLYECGYEIEIESGPALPVYNDPACAAAGREAVTALFGQDCIESPEPWMASETFAETLNIWPGFFALVGIKNEEKGTGAAHHNPKFDIDEDALVYAAGTLLSYTVNVLK